MMWLLLLTACGGPNAPEKPTASADVTDSDSGDTGDSGTYTPTQDTSDGCVTDDEFFAASVAPVLQDCLTCHVAGGAAASTRYQLVPFTSAEAYTTNQATLQSLILTAEGFEALLLAKPTGGVSHGGGQRFSVSDPAYTALQEFITRTHNPGGCGPEDAPAEACPPGVIQPGPSPLRRLTESQYRNTIADLLGVSVPAGTFPTTAQTGSFRTFFENNTVSDASAEQILLAAEYVTAHLDADAARACTDDERARGASEADCARRALLDLAYRAFRRPLSDDEAALVTRYLDAGLSPHDAFTMGVELILQAPQFLYLDVYPSDEVPDQPGIFHLDDYAVAARLSFFLLDTTPDAPLLAEAAAGRLHSRAEVRAQALRLLADPRATRAISAFHTDWLHVYRLNGATRDASLYPTFGPDTLAAMQTELDLFVTEVVWAGDGRFSTLLLDDTTWVNEDLAWVYGLTDPVSGWQRVHLDPIARPGVLTRSAFLSAHAYTASSAPVRRGAWVLEQLYCEDLQPPASVNPNIPEASADLPTIRERLAAHSSDPACASCHVRIDPFGFAFEHFGALGEWRDDWDDTHPVDATGSVDGVDFDGATELIAWLADDERVQACYARRWFEYAAGRAAEATDTCTLDTLSSRFVASGGDIRGLMVDITMSDAFLYRTSLEAE